MKNSLDHIHLLGIGGAAMAPVAGMLKERGYTVTGSDANVYPPASTLLSSLAIPWKEGFRAENLQPAPDLIVVGNAISRGNPELEAALDARIPYWSMPQTLEELFLPGHTPIVVAGTHGKTTTTAMLAWIFHFAGRRPDFLVGGVVPNFGECSYGLGGGEEFIIEGDEYDSAYFDKAAQILALPSGAVDFDFARIRSCGVVFVPFDDEFFAAAQGRRLRFAEIRPCRPPKIGPPPSKWKIQASIVSSWSCREFRRRRSRCGPAEKPIPRVCGIEQYGNSREEPRRFELGIAARNRRPRCAPRHPPQAVRSPRAQSSSTTHIARARVCVCVCVPGAARFGDQGNGDGVGPTASLRAPLGAAHAPRARAGG